MPHEANRGTSATCHTSCLVRTDIAVLRPSNPSLRVPCIVSTVIPPTVVLSELYFWRTSIVWAVVMQPFPRGRSTVTRSGWLDHRQCARVGTHERAAPTRRPRDLERLDRIIAESEKCFGPARR